VAQAKANWQQNRLLIAGASLLTFAGIEGACFVGTDVIGGLPCALAVGAVSFHFLLASQAALLSVYEHDLETCEQNKETCIGPQ